MAGKEQGHGGFVEGYKKLNEATRNILIGIAVVSAAVGAEALAALTLVLAGGDQVQIAAIDRFQKWRNKVQPKPVFP
jgi:hypothetical protein